jgi:hypothetical protein
MNRQPNESQEEQFSSLLAACQEALASGATPSFLGEARISPELKARLERGLACLQRLQGMQRRPCSPSLQQPGDSLLEGTGKVRLWLVREPGPRYSRTRLHAAGGIGQVWLANDAALGRDVALKELRPDRADNPALQARFLHEARITGQLQHPGIVPV